MSGVCDVAQAGWRACVLRLSMHLPSLLLLLLLSFLFRVDSHSVKLEGKQTSTGSKTDCFGYFQYNNQQCQNGDSQALESQGAQAGFSRMLVVPRRPRAEKEQVRQRPPIRRESPYPGGRGLAWLHLGSLVTAYNRRAGFKRQTCASVCVSRTCL